MDVHGRRIIISIAGALAMIGLAVLQGPTGTTAAEKAIQAPEAKLRSTPVSKTGELLEIESFP